MSVSTSSLVEEIEMSEPKSQTTIDKPTNRFFLSKDLSRWGALSQWGIITLNEYKDKSNEPFQQNLSNLEHYLVTISCSIK